MNEHVYIHEDVFLLPGQSAHYLDNMGSTWPFREDCRWDLVGIWGQLRPMGRWPRAVNLWQLDWDRLDRQLQQQYGDQPFEPGFEEWWKRSVTHRKGGFDRLLRPGPGCPDLAAIAGTTPPARPCVVQQVVSVNAGGADPYLEWVAATAVPSLDGTGWSGLGWFAARHAPTAYVYYAAPDWTRLTDLMAALPVPPPDCGAVADTSALQAWPESRYLGGA